MKFSPGREHAFTQHVWPINRRAQWKAWRQLMLTTQPPREHWRVRGRLRFGYIICIMIYIYIYTYGWMVWCDEVLRGKLVWSSGKIEVTVAVAHAKHLTWKRLWIIFYFIVVLEGWYWSVSLPSAESGRFHLAKEGEASGVPQHEVLKNSNFGENCSENNLWIQGDHVPSSQLGETCFKGCLWVCPKIPTVFPLNWILLQQMLGRSLNTSTIHIVSILSKGQVEREPLRSRAPLSLVI